MLQGGNYLMVTVSRANVPHKTALPRRRERKPENGTASACSHAVAAMGESAKGGSGNNSAPLTVPATCTLKMEL